MSDDSLPIAMILKTFVSDGKSIFPMDTIEYESKFWLVPQWLEHKSEGWITPARIICLEGLGYQDLRYMPQRPADFSVGTPIPRAVLDGLVQEHEAARYTVIERPPIRFRKPASVH
jgi:hypothetical protein